MSGAVNIEPLVLTPDDPEYYAELLKKTSRPADWRQPSDQRSSRNIPGIQNIDDELGKRLQTLLDVLANISICQHGNVSATMASLSDGGSGTLKTRLYIIFNYENDDTARLCRNHLETIFQMLRQVTYTPTDRGSPKLIPTTLKEDFLEICRVIHNHSFDVFAYRVNKRAHKLSEIQRYIEQDGGHFTSDQRSMLLKFLKHVKKIISDVADAEHMDQLPIQNMKYLHFAYSNWTRNNLLLQDDQPDNRFTLLDTADNWLVEKHDIGFRLRRWALKIMSFLISANKLFALTQSSRLRGLLNGQFEVEVFRTPITSPYCCILSSKTIQVALDAALAEATSVPEDWDDKHGSFMRLLEEAEASAVVTRKTPTIHPELAMIMAMDKGKIRHVFPYIGVLKLSCIMCIHYIDTFNEATNEKITTKGSHGKAYPWSWPELPDRDGELRPAFMKRVRKQLLEDFEVHARRSSDSSVGSGFPRWEWDEEEDEVLESTE